MVKKIIACTAAFMLAFSMCALGEPVAETTAPEATAAPAQTQEGMPQGGRGGMQPPQMPTGEAPMGGEMQPPEIPGGEMPQGEGIQPPEIPASEAAGSTAPQSETQISPENGTPEGTEGEAAAEMPTGRGGRMGGGMMGQMQETTEAEPQTESGTFMGFVREYFTPILSVVLLALAFLFVKFYK